MNGKFLIARLRKKVVGTFWESERSENGNTGEGERLEVEHDIGKSQSGLWMKRKLWAELKEYKLISLEEKK